MLFNLKFKNFLTSKFNNDLFWNYISLLFLGLSGLGLNVIIGRYYNSSVLGAFNQVLVTYLLASILASGGINFSVLKSINERSNDFIEFIKSLLSSDSEEDDSLIIENYTNLIRSYLLKDTS